MATSSALMMVWVSAWPVASICRVVDVGLWIIAAPSRDSPSMREPSVYIQVSGSNCGAHGMGSGALGRVRLGGDRAAGSTSRGGCGRGWEPAYWRPIAKAPGAMTERGKEGVLETGGTWEPNSVPPSGAGAFAGGRCADEEIDIDALT